MFGFMIVPEDDQREKMIQNMQEEMSRLRIKMNIIFLWCGGKSIVKLSP
jgi:hypothetical protein